MKTVLLGWELGAGFGYCLQLRQIADALAAEEYRPVVALRSLDHAERLFADRLYPVLQAPWIIGRLRPDLPHGRFDPTSFADLMACNGFGSTDHLAAMLRGWRDLIGLVRPDLIVARYAPILGLAAYGRLPFVVFGSAYATPPADAPRFPIFRDDTPPYADQDQLLETVRRVQHRFGAPRPDALTELWRGDRRVVLGLPEFDPYQDTRHEPCAGMFEIAPPPKAVRNAGVHAYLSGRSASTELAVAALAASGLPGRIFARDIDPGLRARIEGTRLCWPDDRPDAIQAASDAALVVHHGGPGMAYATLAAGRPQLLLPQVLDQWFTSGLLDRTGHSVMIGEPVTPGELAVRIRALAADPDAHEAAFDAALDLQKRGLHGAWRKVVGACRDLLS